MKPKLPTLQTKNMVYALLRRTDLIARQKEGTLEPGLYEVYDAQSGIIVIIAPSNDMYSYIGWRKDNPTDLYLYDPVNDSSTPYTGQSTVKLPVRAASTGNVNIAIPPAGGTLDSVVLAVGNRVLLKDQTDKTQNGIYIFNGAAALYTRATDFDAAANVKSGSLVMVTEGTVNADTTWELITNDPIAIGTTALDFIQTSFEVLSKTIAQFNTLITTNKLSRGQLIFISDIEEPLIVEVTDVNKISLNAMLMARNPDYQNAGVYTGVETITGIPFTAQKGVWYMGINATLVNGDVVIYNGYHWQVIDSTQFDGNIPEANLTAFEKLLKTNANQGYIVEWDGVEVNTDALPVSMNITKRADKRGNIIYGVNSFQWGNDSVQGNNVFISSSLNCINNRGTILLNFVHAAGIIDAATTSANSQINRNIVFTRKINCVGNDGFINRNEFGLQSENNPAALVLTVIRNTGIKFNACVVKSELAIIFDPAIDYIGKTATEEFSNFEATIDITGLTSINLLNYRHVGIFVLQNSDIYPLNIDNIANAPTNHPFELRPDATVLTDFRDASISGGNINLEASPTSIDGTKGDYIKFRRIINNAKLIEVRNYL